MVIITCSELLGNIFKNFEYRHCFFGKFEEQYLPWAKENAEDYDKIFIVGMVLDQNLIKKIDEEEIMDNDELDLLQKLSNG